MTTSPPLRIAWIGAPKSGGGVGGFCRQLLTGLLKEGHDLTVLAADSLDDFDEVMGPIGGDAKLVAHPPQWAWNRWYSRTPLGVFFSSFWARRKAYSRVITSLLAEHARQPFDVVVQFSQPELFEMRYQLDRLPPLILFPCVHAAGELTWHRRESKLARRSESRLRHYLVRVNLVQRAHLQRRCYQAVHGVIGMSRRFNELAGADYGIEPERQAVVYQPFDLSEPQRTSAPDVGQAPIRLLFVGRIAVRKGIELVTQLSHRLDDLVGRVEMTIVGGPSFWSDYTGLLRDLNPRLAIYAGALPHREVLRAMAEADVLIVPSHYEPGGIVVAEGLAHGCVIVASDEVGSAEPLPADVCRRFARGDIEGFERSVRSLVEELSACRDELRERATETAVTAFDPKETTRALVEALRRAARREPIGAAMDVPEPAACC